MSESTRILKLKEENLKLKKKIKILKKGEDKYEEEFTEFEKKISLLEDDYLNQQFTKDDKCSTILSTLYKQSYFHEELKKQIYDMLIKSDIGRGYDSDGKEFFLDN